MRCLTRCFAHIVNLVCKDVISAVTALNGVLFSDTKCDPIAATRALIRAVCFASVLRSLDIKILQPLLDVDVCWSSTDIMIERAIYLCEQDFIELRQYKLSDDEWKALHIIHQILTVLHAFQQQLSADKTLTLALAILSFQQMMQLWEELTIKFPDVKPAIKEGLSKLKTYHGRTEIVPAYTLAISMEFECNMYCCIDNCTMFSPQSKHETLLVYSLYA
ncbi:hypothetical protein ARMGADRAFT_948546 [Armillaria gallica]|uniref:hAT-like transposase RNase-H fold domain-containing protein n=1 Tax=Armillaria gallica TaxID=47427 RepID=A0A2H3CDN7_ARMGA|nr:hypothetical protein ARMGADRAFT_948546 [Armillaria gallica]